MTLLLIATAIIFPANDPVYAEDCAPLNSSTAALTVVAVLRNESALAGAHDIEVRAGLAYLAGKGGSLAIVDVRQPAAPKLLWLVRDAVEYEDAETVLPIDRDRLLVGTRDVLLFDVSQPALPKLLARLHDQPRVDTINGFARRGDVVFAANKRGQVFAVDVSRPNAVGLLGARNVRELDGLSSPHDVAMCGELLVVAAAEGFGRDSLPGKVGVYRVFDPASKRVLPAGRWTLVGQLEHRRLAGANRVRTSGNLAYVGCSLSQNANRVDDLRSNVSAIDLSDPAQPRLRASIDFPDARGPNGLALAGSIVFAAGGQTVQAIDVGTAETPRELARVTDIAAFPGGADDAHDLVYHDGHLLVTAQSSQSLVVIQVQGEEILKAADR